MKGDFVKFEVVDVIFDCVEKNFGNKFNVLVYNVGVVIGVLLVVEIEVVRKWLWVIKKLLFLVNLMILLFMIIFKRFI